jgi:hypothetical protein
MNHITNAPNKATHADPIPIPTAAPALIEEWLDDAAASDESDEVDKVDEVDEVEEPVVSAEWDKTAEVIEDEVLEELYRPLVRDRS